MSCHIVPLLEAPKAAVNRLLTGPLDVLASTSETRHGFSPHHLAVNSNKYFLLESSGSYVGFCSVFYDKKYKAATLNEFEIFHEYRGEKYGGRFAKQVWESLPTLCRRPRAKKRALFEILSPAFRFWWRTVGGTYFVQHIADVIDAPSVENPSDKFLSWLYHYKHAGQPETEKIFREIFELLQQKMPLSNIVQIVDSMILKSG